MSSGGASHGGVALAGSCHCGAVTLGFTTSRDPAELSVRECQCSFCRKHATRNVTDREGHVTLRARRDDVTRYQFATRGCEFLLCRRCSVYVAAIVSDGSGPAVRHVATVNARLFGHDFADATTPVEYGHESADARRARRLANWTPAHLALG